MKYLANREDNPLQLRDIARLTPRQIRTVYLVDRDDKGKVVLELNNNSEPLISNYERVERYCKANGVNDPAVIQAEFLKWYPTDGTG